jgi:class 3 adenylate cyclase
MMEVVATRALIFYVDVTGFSSWSRRVRRERVRDLISDTYSMYDRWARRHACWMKKQADGMIAAWDLSNKGDRTKIIHALHAIGDLSIELNRYLHALVYPRPVNGRIRGVVGEAWRFDNGHGWRDYAGDPMDFGRRLCDVAKEELIILSDGIYDGIGGRLARGIRLRELSLGDLNLIGVHPEDQKRFWTFTPHGRRK